LKHLFNVWPRIRESLADSCSILLLLDYDGTLAPTADRPENAFIPSDVLLSLRNIVLARNVVTGIISGRELTDLKSKIGIEGLIYAGNHGMEIEGPGLNFVSPVGREMIAVLSETYHTLYRALSGINGILIENKRLSLSVHYRLVAPQFVRDIEKTVREITESSRTNNKLKMTQGKKVYEVRPAIDWDKGKATSLLIDNYLRGNHVDNLTPMFFGDDLTDEDAFKSIVSYRNSISVFIGNPGQPSRAKYSLYSTEEVALFLNLFLYDVCRQTSISAKCNRYALLP
jgi:trehalose 6-phosphate phosphatase